MRPTLPIAIAALCLSVPALAELHFAEKTLQLTATSDDQTLTAQFPLQNTGTEPVFVASIITSCSCTTARVGKMHIEPGEEGIVTVTYKIGVNEGPQSQTVTLLTNEKEGTAYTLTIKTDIPKRARPELPRVVPVTPTLLFWSKKPFQTKTVQVDLSEIQGAKLSATCSNERFKISIKRTADAREALLEITPDTNATEARASLDIVIEHGTEKFAVHTVSLTLLVK